ncbi:carnitine O-palmitoyltransferase 2, mitochondrial-like isoform X2 [Diachasmimorpha longicaudata]|uniref:carnitine O-palmitoyltransferase 2, mitochondrial-like isoform X2 n=1 Tax=Diachasmimorpha longicaudata TaxID=58733 RepID=UPI0030B8B86E
MFFPIKNVQYLKGCKADVLSRLLFALPSRAISSGYNEYDYLQNSRLPTMYFQKSLPRLPIPKLEDTCKRYLKAQEPILSPEDFKKTCDNTAAFQSKEGPQLQKKLLEMDSSNKHTSYISEPWFDMYLRDRKPLPINYNPFMIMVQEDNASYNEPLVKITNLLISSARFMNSLRAGILKPEVYHMNPKKSDTPFFQTITGLLPSTLATYGAYLFKAFPLDMSQFPYLFGTTRIPEIEKDRIYNNPTSRHVIIMRRGHFYSFNLLNENGGIRSPEEIASSVRSILNDTRGPNECPIGILTATERNQWARNRQHLLSLGNEEVLREIDSATFVFALDDDSLEENHNKLLRHFLHSDGSNRWFDKSFSLIINGRGYAGLNFEHSWGDGVAVLRYFTNLKADIKSNPSFHPEDQSKLTNPSQDVKRLVFKVDDALKASVSRALREYHHWAYGTLSLDHQISEVFGKKQCKGFGVSPDAVMQVAFQLALYKLEKRSVPTYESCSTSAFRHGRTETIRSCTSQTKALCKAIVESGSSKVNDNELKKLIVECSKSHNGLTKEAAMGQGFDRHLFALKKVWEQSKVRESLPVIFQDPAYDRINRNILSTSTLSSPDVLGGGFGPVVENGYGIGYMIQDNRLGSVVTCYKSHRDATEFIDHLETSFKDLHRILESK